MAAPRIVVKFRQRWEAERFTAFSAPHSNSTAKTSTSLVRVALFRLFDPSSQPLPKTRVLVEFSDQAGVVIKRLTLVLSLFAAAVGAWDLARGHAQVSACNSYVAHLQGTNASTLCSRAESNYLIGVALTMGGLVIVTLVVFAMVKRARANGWQKSMPTIPQAQRQVVGSAAH